MVRLPSPTDTQSYKYMHTHKHASTDTTRTHTDAHKCIKPLQNLLKVLPITTVAYFKHERQSWANFSFFFFQQLGPFSVVYIHVISSLISSEAKLAL